MGSLQFHIDVQWDRLDFPCISKGSALHFPINSVQEDSLTFFESLLRFLRAFPWMSLQFLLDFQLDPLDVSSIALRFLSGVP